jgi:hypothetical protein
MDGHVTWWKKLHEKRPWRPLLYVIVTKSKSMFILNIKLNNILKFNILRPIWWLFSIYVAKNKNALIDQWPCLDPTLIYSTRAYMENPCDIWKFQIALKDCL